MPQRSAPPSNESGTTRGREGRSAGQLGPPPPHSLRAVLGPRCSPLREDSATPPQAAPAGKLERRQREALLDGLRPTHAVLVGQARFEGHVPLRLYRQLKSRIRRALP